MRSDDKYKITIRNWENYQTAPKGKGQRRRRRDWIAIHTGLGRDPDFYELDLCERVAWVMLLCHAGVKGPSFELSPSVARALWNLYRNPDFEALEKQGFIDLERPTYIQRDSNKPTNKHSPSVSTPIAKKKVKKVVVKKPEVKLVRFDAFWSAYPSKTGKKRCKKIWASNKLDDVADKIIADVEYRKVNFTKWLGGFVWNPSTYLNGELWNDETIQTKEAGDETYAQRTARSVKNLERAEAEAAGEKRDPDERHRSAL